MSDAEYSNTTDTEEFQSPYAPLINQLHATFDALAEKHRQLAAQQAIAAQRFYQSMQYLQAHSVAQVSCSFMPTRHPLEHIQAVDEFCDNADERLATHMSSVRMEMFIKVTEIEELIRAEEQYMADQRKKREERWREEEVEWAVQVEAKSKFFQAWIESVEARRDENAEESINQSVEMVWE